MSTDDDVSDMGGNLVRMIKQGQSFSGRERNCVFLNTEQPQFANVSSVSGLDFDDDARAAAKVDWDFDGDIDLWFANRNAPGIRFMRNELNAGSGFVSFRLRGVNCNRDAIGARVEVRVKGDARPLARTVVAGDGYLAQSSKWIHVGLGEPSEIESVRVRWPGGQWESFTKVESGRQYQLVEQTGVAKPWTVPDHSRQLATQDVELPNSTAKGETYFAARIPVPRLEYEDERRNLVALEVSKPTLLILWASWCQPCVEELSQIGQKAIELQNQGVRVIALSVDSLDPQNGNVELAESILAKISFPFEHGFASASTVHKMQLLNDHLFGLQRPLPIPTSFLIDEQNRLAAIYKGAIELDRVRQDIHRLNFDATARRDASVPFPGRWLGKPRTLRLAPLVVELARAGYLEDASEYVQRMQNRFDRATILDLVVRLGVGYYREQKLEYANLHFQMARKIDAKTVLPEIRLGKYFEKSGRYAEAAQVYGSKPNVLGPRLAWLWATCPDPTIRSPDRAIEFAKRSGGRTASVLDILAAGLAAKGEFPSAVDVGSQAISLAKQAGQHRSSEEIAQRVTGYRSRQPYVLSN